MSDIATNSLAIDGLNIFYRDTQTGKSNLLLLHGWGLSSEAYTGTIKRLAKRFRVVAPDLPTFGLSDAAPQGWAFADYGHLVVKFIQTVLAAPCIVVGHSFGGGVGICLAQDHADYVRALVLVDSAGVPLKASFVSLGVRKFVELLLEGASISRSGSVILMFTVFTKNALMKPGAMLSALHLPNVEDLSKRLSGLKVPIKILWAQKDMVISIAKGRELASLAKTRVVLAPEHLYHEWCVTSPDDFAELIFHFCAQEGLLD